MSGWPSAGGSGSQAAMSTLIRKRIEVMMNANQLTEQGSRHRGPNLGMLALAFTALFIAGLYFVISFSADAPHFPGPWESSETIRAYFQGQPQAVLMCAFLQFGSAIPLALYTATVVSRLNFLGAKVAGVHIALFGGLISAFNVALSALVLWVMSYPGIAQEASVIRTLYYLTFAVGGVGYSVPLGLLIAGISVPSGFMKLLPKWLVVVGLLIAVCGELSWFSLVFPQLVFFIPLTRFPGFIWLIAAGFMLPKALVQKEPVT
jgi:hypothetical protein